MESPDSQSSENKELIENSSIVENNENMYDPNSENDENLKTTNEINDQSININLADNVDEKLKQSDPEWSENSMDTQNDTPEIDTQNDTANPSEHVEESRENLNEPSSNYESNIADMSVDDSSNLYPQYDLRDTPPSLIGQISFPEDENQYYLRGCKWSPDGTCLLYAIRGNGMSIVELPTDLYTGDTISSTREVTQLKPVITIAENGMLYDFCWYPGMTSQDPATCCWLTTSQHAPVQLWDAFTGQLRCTYRGYDLVDEVEAALSVNFSFDAKQVYCGYRKALRTFDTNRPGRDFVYYKMSYPVTCIAVNYVNPGQVALGSWHKLIEIVDDRSGTIRQIKKMTGHFGGITQLKFSPDGNYLYSGARKDDELICWDMRSPGRPVFSLTRKVDTNQRIYFDISPCGSHIFTGNTNGFLKIWNLLENDPDTESKFQEFKYQLHLDCLNSVSIHPYRPILATGSGQHHFFGTIDDEDSIITIDNSLKIWWIGKVKCAGNLD